MYTKWKDDCRVCLGIGCKHCVSVDGKEPTKIEKPVRIKRVPKKKVSPKVGVAKVERTWRYCPVPKRG